MNKWRQTSIGDFVNFNPSEHLSKNKLAKKIPMDKLGTYERKIKGYEMAEYKSGPKFRNGDTLVAKITPCLENGKTAYVDILGEDEVAFGSSEFIVLRENTLSDRKFIYYLARSPLFRERAISCMEGTSGRKRVNEGTLKRQEIVVPLKDEQVGIAHVLSILDDKIELNNHINAELEAMAKTLYDYWFVQFDFPDKNGKPYKSSGGKMVYNEVLKREIPEGWTARQLHQVANITMGQSPSGKSYNESGEGMIFFQGSTDFGWRYPNIRIFTTAPTRFAQEGDVLLSVRAPIGTMNIAMDACCIGRGLASLNSKDGFSSFLIYQMNYFKKKFDYLNSVGTTFGSLTKDGLYNLELAYPSINILKSFETIVSKIDDKIKLNIQQNQQLSTLRDWLLPMLMNGQVKVGKNYTRKEEPLPIAAEPESVYKKGIGPSIPENKKGFAKQVLAGEIVTKFQSDPNFTDIKFQKIQFLAEHIIEADLNLNYYYQVAGPYDNKFMHTIYGNFRKQKWFDCRNGKIIPLEKQGKIETYYHGYFAPAEATLNNLFNLLHDSTEAQAEIIATLYAVWNNRIIEEKPVTDDDVITGFYNWSKRKLQYSEKQVREGLQWLRDNQMEPKGFGKLIKKSKR